VHRRPHCEGEAKYEFDLDFLLVFDACTVKAPARYDLEFEIEFDIEPALLE
jgi:hypothetical protein